MTTVQILEGLPDNDLASVSSYNDKTGGGTTSGGDNADKDEKGWFSFLWDDKDNKFVFFWMGVVLVTIASTGVFVLIFTANILRDDETKTFENAFHQHVRNIAEGTLFQAKTIMSSMETLADTITIYAEASQDNWPFLVVPESGRRALRTRVDAKLDLVGFSPIVANNETTEWTVFSSYELEDVTAHSIPYIYRLDDNNNDQVIPDTTSNQMLPVWQTSPTPYNTSLINYNLISAPKYGALFADMMETQHTAISAIYSDYDLDTFKNQQFFDPSDFNSTIPRSVIVMPVYNSFLLEQRSIVGVVHGVLPWDRFLTGILPEGVNGIIAVIRNTCGDRYSFLLNGPDVVFLGPGDVNGTNNDYITETIWFGVEFLRSPSTLSTSTRPKNIGDTCVYSVGIYPSEEFERFHGNSNVEVFTVMYACVFLFLMVVFFIFVWFVQKRQARVMKIATRTTAIISTLFPDNVRDRIMKQAEDQASREQLASSGGDDASSANFQNLKSLLTSGDKAAAAGKQQSQELGNGTDHMASVSLLPETAPSGVTTFQDKPIADLYPNCTVCFMDLVGFTSWSSTRDPVQVFSLLETLYGAFDSIANRRRIFKVETIGDCYVAVVGLPKPRRDHALAMTRFCHDCLIKSGEVFHFLEESLGPGTSGLNLRLGLHSGPVTAGVLRGLKGRFQLFGDTVNTSARMESNSAAGKILCSQDTADLLIAGGKRHWVSPRAEKIVAKGKGEMQTFWVTIKNTKSVLDGSVSEFYSRTSSTVDDSQAGGDDGFVDVESGADGGGAADVNHHHDEKPVFETVMDC
ncbi:Receptor-type guanylate cyclase gcy [Seminavis robusta]|uniref:Receptor-type guanylate cyclase gcy n=1 Tax=Seminavis robusta TaxID=568900 RepID=A0A9N8DXX4_9STRA|nr:Receptor-type guanylate cyclase gcy [Seminavis robusta]|eukprot:Sro433_g141840.1 Receptor-type guanylate cyclase gcy (802) ;mRNA; r:32535-35115